MNPLPHQSTDLPSFQWTPTNSTADPAPANSTTNVSSSPSLGITAPQASKCPKCFNTLQSGDQVKQLGCSHVFHSRCIDEWLANNLTCPACNTQVLFPVATMVNPSTIGSNNYANCRDCGVVFYRDPETIRPETNAFYRCPKCRNTDVFELARNSCVLT